MKNSSVFNSFPSDFKFGAATASYQIEGTSFAPMGRSHWDDFAAQGGTLNGDDGRNACAHYLHWEKDLDLMVDAGLDAYRFSIAWPRVFPNLNELNSEGLDFYERLIDGALARGLEPHATLYHWDLPDYLARKGGWENGDIADHLADFGVAVHKRLGDRLASIATINEPWCAAWLSHFLGSHAPGKKSLEAAVPAMHNIMKAHGRTISALRGEGAENLGIVLNMEHTSAVSSKEADVKAAELHDGIFNRWFISSITKGEYPEDVMSYFEPHMPDGWQQDLAEISKPIDWLGLNYYTRILIEDDATGVFPFGKRVAGDRQKNTMGWEFYPEGLRHFLNLIRTEYAPNTPLWVTENGMSAHDAKQNGAVDDPLRVEFFDMHLDAVSKAIDDGCDVRGYFLWSLLDNFEWAFGYSERFGVVHVDFDTFERTPKTSYEWFKDGLSKRER